MGTKFAHFSILGNNMQEAKQLLDFLPGTPATALEKMEKLKKQALDHNTENKQGLVQLFDSISQYMSESVYYLMRNNRWITVLNESFSFENIDNIATFISNNCSATIFSLGYYDDDTLVFSILRKGRILTHHASGSPSSYGMEECPGDIDVIADVFQLKDKKEFLKSALMSEDIMEKPIELEKFFDMAIWLNLNYELEQPEADSKFEKVVIR